MAETKTFTGVVNEIKGRCYVPVPFDPDELWGKKQRHHIHGTINGMGYRGVIEPIGDERGFSIGAAWRRDCGIATGDKVKVVLKPEGPQRDDLAPDIAAALTKNPRAAELFDSLAQFYRKAYLTWINATKRSPELRAERIAEMIRLLKQGHKQRPGT